MIVFNCGCVPSGKTSGGRIEQNTREGFFKNNFRGSAFFAQFVLLRSKRSNNHGDSIRNVIMRIAVRLARSDTGMGVNECLAMPLNELAEWVEIISDENKKS